MANFNLTGQKIKNTYDQLAQVSASLLVDGLGNATTISASNIQNFDTEVSKSAASSGFGAGSGGVSEAVFTAYTSSNDTKVDALIAATSSYLTSVPSGTVSSSAQIATDISGAFASDSSSIASELVVLDDQVALNITRLNSLTTATASYVTNSETSSFVTNSQTSSMTVESASFAITASYAENAGGAAFPFTGSAGISGSINMNSNGKIQISNYTGSLHATSILIGQELDPSRVNAPGDRNVQIGHYSRIVDSSTRSNVVVIGSDAEAAQNCVVIGQGARGLVDKGIIIGQNSTSNQNGSVILGADLSGTKSNGILIGNGVADFQINIGGVFVYGSGSSAAASIQSQDFNLYTPLISNQGVNGYADDSAAKTAGLVVGDVYHTSGSLKVIVS